VPSPRFHETILAPVTVVGSGVAGMTAALAAAPRPVVLLTRTPGLPGGSSRLAQGGVAVALGPGDSPDAHARDTVAAAAGLADPAAVRVLTAEGPEAVRWLLGLGARFDRGPGGALARGREGAHFRRDRPGRPVGAPRHLLWQDGRPRWGTLEGAREPRREEVAP